jgi:hypothetical protein
LAGERVKSDDCISLLKMVIQMKEKEVFKENILPKEDEPFFKWIQSMWFKLEMILLVEEGLKEIDDKVRKDQDKDLELMKGLHKDS